MKTILHGVSASILLNKIKAHIKYDELDFIALEIILKDYLKGDLKDERTSQKRGSNNSKRNNG